RITALPVIPNTLKFLNCHNNYITQLPSIPPKLWYLHGEYNCYNSIPENPNPELLINYKVSPNRLDCKKVKSKKNK
ncbi:MAG: hypothetical protein ACXWFZ_12335, partial [Nitrososphaeraceae archaeon]